MLLRRVTYENLRRNNNRRNSRSDSRKVFALRPETSLRIYTYAPDRHSLPVRQTLPPVRKTETEEKTVRRLLLQIPARLRKVLTIINCGEATLLPPRFCFSIRHRKDVLFYSVIASAAWRSRRLAYERLCNLLRRLATGLPRSLRSLAKTFFLFRHRERSVAATKIGARTPMQYTPSFGNGIAAVASPLAKTSFFIPSSRR